MPLNPRTALLVLLVLAAGLLGGCSQNSDIDEDRELGEAYAAPMSMPLYTELAARPKVAATVKHGEKVTIVGKRRRFLKVRTRDGKTGWTDSRQLLLRDGLDALKELAAKGAKAPAFGSAMVYEPLNVHIAPNRLSPSFVQVQPNERMDVIDYELLERTPYVYPEILPPPPKVEPRRAKKKGEASIRPPAAPDAPALPPNWMELSRSAELEQERPDTADRETAKPAAPVEDAWSLVRLKDGRCGWALTRLLTMAIPDDVAQYSERQRITSYVALGFVEDGGEKKGIWLWTTLSDTRAPYHFDGFRLFTYNVKRRRYETAYRERDIAGYLPIEAQPTANGIGSSFALLLRGENGLVRREYRFNGYRLQVVGEAPAKRRQNDFLDAAAIQPATESGGGESLKDNLENKLKSLLK